MPEEMISQIDDWAEANGLGRSEAIRRLVELGLKAKK
jgi:metal-responsive CopG/Arc/MetJ family transcriptional regulator